MAKIEVVLDHRRYVLKGRTWASPKDGVIRDQGILKRLEGVVAAEHPDVPRGDLASWDGTYHVYAIELREDAGKRRDPSKPIIYVGQTWLNPRERLEQHRNGIRASRWVRKYGLDLRDDLVAHVPRLTKRDDAVRWEKRVAEQLEKALYTVKGGH